MSLILEALKRSEQERRRERAPDLQTIHQPLSGRAPARSRAAPWVVALVLVNIGILAGWWIQQRGRVPQEPVQVAPNPAAPVPGVLPVAPAGSAVAANSPPPAATIRPTNSAHSDFTQITPSAQPTTGTVPSRRNPIREIAELPDNVRKGLPAMTFSFHVYSSDPQKRTIIINNRRLREGDEVDEGVALEEITGDGVILAIPDYRVHVGVLAGW